jgi:hypothetical protein
MGRMQAYDTVPSESNHDGSVRLLRVRKPSYSLEEEVWNAISNVRQFMLEHRNNSKSTSFAYHVTVRFQEKVQGYE